MNRRENPISSNEAVSTPIGNRRTRAEQRQEPTDDNSPMPATPSWANYLNKLGEQVLSDNKGEHQQLNAPAGPQPSGNAGSTHVRQRVNSISPDESAHLPIGNRRTEFEQAPQAPIVRTPPNTHETPYWSDYLNKLGEPLKPPQLAKPQPFDADVQISSAPEAQQPAPHRELPCDTVDHNDGRANAKQHENSASSNEAAHIPIGDRRTWTEQRHDTSAQPAIHQTRASYWSSLLKGLLTLLKRPVASKNLSGTGEHPVEADAAFHTKISLGIWGYYFAVKLALFWMDLIPFHPLENLALALFILFSNRSLFLYRIKNTLIFVAALALLYYDTWLPPIGNVVSPASSLSDFKLIYLVELISRFISLPVIAILLIVCLSYWIASYRLRVGTLVIACLTALYLFEHPVPMLVAEQAPSLQQDTAAYLPTPDISKVEQTFFDNEAQRSIWLPIPQADAVPFDVIFIQVCSLSWDDLRYVGLDQHPLWQRFDMLMTKFNSAASYSGPAAIRLLRATCGQPKHTSMYIATDDNCYLMDNLRNSGFETNLALNHNGRFDDFLGAVKAHGRLTAAPTTLNGLDVTQRAFDGAPVYDDLEVLNRWLETRQKSSSSRVALFYNTVSLHDGNQLRGTESISDTTKTYQKRMRTFLDEMEQFMQSLENSGKRAVVVMVPEHGGAVRGDSRQISGLREIPTPAITLVPVGIKVIGGNTQRKGDTLLLDQPTSYLAISHIVARMLENSPFTSDTFAPSDYVADLPSTQFVAQSQSATVIEVNDQLHLRHGSSNWEKYSERN
ncbi:MAG: cellulose biosynthesis protein BcsG [Gallionella sp.]|nr:cellulose biosynthesis protein BcsG [Gallionella sp.]MDP1939953.1 cellulose biosynthesis protein BcsG [Gallionella sp.]